MSGDQQEDDETPSDAWREVGDRLREAANSTIRALEAKYDDLPKPLVFLLGVAATVLFENAFRSLYRGIRGFASGLDPFHGTVELGPPPEFPVAEGWVLWFVLIAAAMNGTGGLTTSVLRDRVEKLEQRISELEEE